MEAVKAFTQWVEHLKACECVDAPINQFVNYF